MTDDRKQIVRAIPEGYHTVTPWIIARDSAALIVFLEAAFGAAEIARVVNDDGSIGHAEVRIGDPTFTAAMEYVQGAEFFRN